MAEYLGKYLLINYFTSKVKKNIIQNKTKQQF